MFVQHSRWRWRRPEEEKWEEWEDVDVRIGISESQEWESLQLWFVFSPI